MAGYKSTSTATIKFFSHVSGSSESDLSDLDDLCDPHKKRGAAADSGKAEKSFQEDSSGDGFDTEGRDREDSIYDTAHLDDLTFSRSSRQRTESDSNYLWGEENDSKDLPLIMGMTDDHFGVPGDLSRLRDVNQEIEKMKLLIYTTPDENALEKGQLIEKLIGLRLRKSELEHPDTSAGSDRSKTIYGHEFHLKEATAEAERFCEVCCAVVWGVIHSWYTCVSCHVCCHDKCLNSLKRMCAARKVTDSSSFVLNICRERGLAIQNYKCFECQTPISYKAGSVEPRQCDYTGNYYCPMCHWNDEMVIPARVVHNWDFQPRKVCRASKQYLRLMRHKPVLCVEASNRFLMNFVEELSEMKKLRHEILLMKVYFLSCQSAMQSKILLLLEARRHFVENADYYTMHDLLELVSERLLPEIVNVHANFASHIKVNCPLCRCKGYYCEICQKAEILFPFDNICVVCPECSNVFHKHCYAKVEQTCSRCERKRKRLAENERKAEILKQIEEANRPTH